MSDDHARPIPQGRGRGAADDVFVVDTRGAGATAYDELGRPLPPAGGGRPPKAPRAPRRRRPGGGRRGVRAVLVLLLLWVVFLVVTPLHAWTQVTREDTTPGGDRPTGAEGSTYLLVGSDSREGLTAEERKALGVGGDAKGRRTDSIILIHTPSGSGKPVVISIPRDSYLEIPGEGKNKVNAAFAIGGPQLLAETLEKATGLPIDGYVEIGFGGFAKTVDSLDGVEMCVPRAIKDKKAHIDLQKGCQTLDGKNALGYVRARYSDPKGDLGRAERQRQFLGAVMKKAATPSTVLIPWRWWGFTHAAASGVIVGEDTSLADSYAILSTMRKVSSDEALSLVVPISTTNATTRAGSSVLWDKERADALFGMLKDGEPITTAPAGTDREPSGR
ncbi:LCP family protein [Oryzobacter telluris]|uniref:LCP family protein n=1 Tax=Oryzobacter telluris TaxID=3149179 RepID=UPI00370D8810